MKLLEAPSPVIPTLAQVVAGEAPTGAALRIAGDTRFEDLAPRLAGLDLIVIDFAAFRDGRGFSLASMLRERGWKGELRAAGDLIADHASLLARCGFDSAEAPADASPEEWARAASAFTAVYQPAADGRERVADLRHRPPSAPPSNSPAAKGLAIPDDEARVRALNAEFRDAQPQAILEAALEREFKGRVALLSSFGAEAAVGLHMVSRLDPSTPVLFLDTDRHFQQTLEYRDRLADHLGLSDVRSLKPVRAAEADPRGDLWRENPDLCCAVRKVRPLAQTSSGAVGGFDALVTGRKRFQGGERLRLPVFGLVDGQVKINPLANWTAEMIEAYFETHALPRHPLAAVGYRSIGCWPCTQPSADSEDARAGRWSGVSKTECGIHMPSRWVAEHVRRRAS